MNRCLAAKRNIWIKFITFVVITTYLCVNSNCVLAKSTARNSNYISYTNKLAADSKIDSEKFQRVFKQLSALKEVFDGLGRPTAKKVKAAEKKLQNELNNQNIRFLFNDETKSFYLYSVKPKNGPGVVWRIYPKGMAARDHIFDREKPFVHEYIEMDKYEIKIYQKTPYMRDRLEVLEQRLVWDDEWNNGFVVDTPSEFARQVLKEIPPNSDILELGCGSGADSIYFAKNNHQVAAVDFQDDFISMLQRRIEAEKINSRLTAKKADITQPFDFPDESFDIVYIHLGMQFYRDAQIEDIISEIRRVLRPGGKVYLMALSEKDYNYGKGEVIEKDTFRRGAKIEHFFTGQYLREKFWDFDIELIKEGKRIFHPKRQRREKSYIQLKAVKGEKEVSEALPAGHYQATDLKPIGDSEEYDLDYKHYESVRSEILRSRKQEFIEEARKSGFKKLRVENGYIQAAVIEVPLYNNNIHAFSFKTELGWIIVLNKDSEHKYEGKYHERQEAYWIDKGFTQKEAHIIASAVQVAVLGEERRLTDYHFDQLWGLKNTDVSRNKLLDLSLQNRMQHHELLERANEHGVDLCIEFTKLYEQLFRETALAMLIAGTGGVTSRNVRENLHAIELIRRTYELRRSDIMSVHQVDSNTLTNSMGIFEMTDEIWDKILTRAQHILTIKEILQEVIGNSEYPSYISWLLAYDIKDIETLSDKARRIAKSIKPTIYTISDGKLSLDIVPDIGNTIISMKQIMPDGNEVEVLHTPNSMKDLIGTNGLPLCGMPILFPWSNRIKDGKFTFEGHEYKVPNNWTYEDNPIHGMVYNKEWKVEGYSSTWIRCSYDMGECDSGYECFSHLKITVTYILEDGKLKIKTRITNNNNKPAPIGLGFHPWFKVQERGSCSVSFPHIDKVWELGDQCMPTGNLNEISGKHNLIRDGNPLGREVFDNVYRVSDKGRIKTVLKDPVTGTAITVESSPEFGNWAVCVPDWKDDTVLIEPCTSATNAFNLGQEESNLIVLNPGESFDGDIAISIESIAESTQDEIDGHIAQDAELIDEFLEMIGEDEITELIRRREMGFIYNDPALKRDVIENVDMDMADNLKHDIAYTGFKNDVICADMIVDFAQAVLNREDFKGKKIVVLGRAADLIYDALYGLVNTFPEYHDRISDLVLMDFSKNKMGNLNTDEEKIEAMVDYIKSHGIDTDDDIVFVDELGFGMDQTNYVLLLKKFLIDHMGYQEDNISTALMYWAEEVARDRVYHNIPDDHPIVEMVDFIYSLDLRQKGKTYESKKAFYAAMWLGYEYNSRRDYNVVLTGCKLHLTYRYLRLDRIHYYLYRFFYKCRIYREVCERYMRSSRYELARVDDTEQDGIDGHIAQDTELIDEFREALDKNEIKTETVRDEDIDLIELLEEVLDSGVLTEEEEVILRALLEDFEDYSIELFDEQKWIKGENSFVLAWNDRTRKRILIAKTLYSYLKYDRSLSRGLLIHELLCAPLQELYGRQYGDRKRGHYRAIEIQQKCCSENYNSDKDEYIERGGLRYIKGHSEKLFKGELGKMLRDIINDIIIDRRTIMAGWFYNIDEPRLYRECYSGVLDFVFDDVLFEEGALYELSDREIELTKNVCHRGEVFSKPDHVRHIVDFAKTILDREDFKGKKIMVLGRAGDLIYDALYGLVNMLPQYRDRIGDLVLMDFSLREGFTQAYHANPRVLAEYVQGHGINPSDGVVIIDEIAIGSEDLNYVLLLKGLLVDYLKYPEGNVKTALIHSKKTLMEIGVSSIFDSDGMFNDKAFLSSDEKTLREVDLVYTDFLRKLGLSKESNGARSASLWMADHYDSGRTFEIAYKAGVLQTVYTYSPNRSYCCMKRFLYKCRVYRDIAERFLDVEQSIRKTAKELLSKTEREIRPCSGNVTNLQRELELAV